MAQMSRPAFESHHPVWLQLYEHPSADSVVLVVEGRSYRLMNDLARKLARCLRFFPGVVYVTVDTASGTASSSWSPTERDCALPVRFLMSGGSAFSLQRDTSAALGVAMKEMADDMDVRAVIES